MEPEHKYCAFIDVLGYKNLVMDSSLSITEKIKVLESIYTNLATQFVISIRDINLFYADQIYVRSFSDCFYLDCTALEPLLIAVKSIFESAFGFYASFGVTEEKTPLLRCGIVKDWLLKFNDIGAMLTGTGELNPVGLAVTRAYLTSEDTKLSGMRIIIAPEVIDDLGCQPLTTPDFQYHTKDIRTFEVDIRYYFKHLSENRCGQPINLFELLWTFNRTDDNIFDCIHILGQLKPTFPTGEDKHFFATVKLFIDSYSLSQWKIRDVTKYNQALRDLQALL